jgi:hypothetical protein
MIDVYAASGPKVFFGENGPLCSMGISHLLLVITQSPIYLQGTGTAHGFLDIYRIVPRRILNITEMPSVISKVCDFSRRQRETIVRACVEVDSKVLLSRKNINSGL